MKFIHFYTDTKFLRFYPLNFGFVQFKEDRFVEKSNARLSDCINIDNGVCLYWETC